MSKKLVLLNQIFLFNAVWLRIIFIVPVLLSSCQFFSNEDRQQSLVYLPILESQKKPLVGSEPFRLIDQFSTAHAINNYKDKKSIFLIYINKACFKLNEKIILNSLPSFAEPELQGAVSVPLFITKGVGETYGDYQHIKTPVLFDDFQFVTKAYGLSEIGSFVELQTSDNQVLSRGRIPLAKKDSKMCAENVEEKDSPVTFVKVQPIFASQCMWCHQRREDIDYFKTMNSIQNWSKMILKTMQTYRMPPGGIDTKLDGFPQYGMVRHEELLPLYKWLEQGAAYTKKDEDILRKIRSKIQESNKKNMSFDGRKPDFRFKMEQADEIPATGSAFVIRSPLAGPFAEDTYLEAAQLEVNKNVTHHTRLFYSSEKIKRGIANNEYFKLSTPIESFSQKNSTMAEILESKELFQRGFNFTGSLLSYKGNEAVFIPKGSYLGLDNHYEPNGKKSKNQAVVLLYKYNKTELPKKIFHKVAWQGDFSLAPHQSNLEIYSVFSIRRKAQLVAILPHVHYRAKDFKLFLKRPNVDSKLIFSTPFLLFKLSLRGNFIDPIDLNSGDELHGLVRYDNSAMNIGNPDPSKKIDVGLNLENNDMHLIIFRLKEY